MWDVDPLVAKRQWLEQMDVALQAMADDFGGSVENQSVEWDSSDLVEMMVGCVYAYRNVILAKRHDREAIARFVRDLRTTLRDATSLAALSKETANERDADSPGNPPGAPTADARHPATSPDGPDRSGASAGFGEGGYGGAGRCGCTDEDG